MEMKAIQRKDIGYTLDRQPLHSAEALAVGWIQLLVRNDKIAEGPHLIIAYLIAPAGLGLSADVQLPSTA